MRKLKNNMQRAYLMARLIMQSIFLDIFKTEWITVAQYHYRIFEPKLCEPALNVELYTLFFIRTSNLMAEAKHGF